MVVVQKLGGEVVVLASLYDVAVSTSCLGAEKNSGVGVSWVGIWSISGWGPFDGFAFEKYQYFYISQKRDRLY